MCFEEFKTRWGSLSRNSLGKPSPRTVDDSTLLHGTVGGWESHVGRSHASPLYHGAKWDGRAGVDYWAVGTRRERALAAGRKRCLETMVILLLRFGRSLVAAAVGLNLVLSMADGKRLGRFKNGATIPLQRREAASLGRSYGVRSLQDSSAGDPYNVTLVVALSYLNDTVASDLESRDPSSALVSHFCMAVNSQVRSRSALLATVAWDFTHFDTNVLTFSIRSRQAAARFRPRPSRLA
jgi:hypothetical protein